MPDNNRIFRCEINHTCNRVLTFRRMPSAILHISTFPFIPPSTLSGWLRRLYLMQIEIYLDTLVDQPDYYVMPREFHVLGAYPHPNPTENFTYIPLTAKVYARLTIVHSRESPGIGTRKRYTTSQLGILAFRTVCWVCLSHRLNLSNRFRLWKITAVSSAKKALHSLNRSHPSNGFSVALHSKHPMCRNRARTGW